jgi:uncharacterized protein (TIGR04141 family)
MAIQSTVKSITVYLAKDGIRDWAQFLRDASALKRFGVRLGDAPDGELFVQHREASTPAWASLFDGQVPATEIGEVSNTAAALLVRVKNRIMAVTFGFGRHLLDEARVEARFGLKATLNSVAPNKIRSIDKASFDALHRQTRTQASRTATAEEFGVDIEQDLVRAITGIPTDTTLGNMLSGLDALHASVTVSLPTLPELLRQYFAKYESKDYQTSFPWIDNISEIGDQRTLDTLWREVSDRIKAQDWRNVQLVLPAIIDWNLVAGFRYGQRDKNARHSDLEISHWAEEQADLANIDGDRLRRMSVYCINADFEPLYEWPLHKCLYSEASIGKEDFVLSNGSWYRIERNFAASVTAEVGAIPRHQGRLPVCDLPTETLYNSSVAKANPDLLLMDRKQIHYGGGRSSIEFCDLLSRNQELIHLKWYGGSAVLSHLFAQGLVAGELFASDPDFRKKLNAKLSPGFRLKDPRVRPDPTKYTIIYGIIDFDRNITELPFFSRINLRAAARRLRGLGYQVRYALIPADPLFKVTSVAKTKPAKKA